MDEHAYDIRDLENAKINLDNVQSFKPDQDGKEIMDGTYTPNQPFKMKCSLCRKNKLVYVIVGKQVLRDMSLRTKPENQWGRKFFIYCKSCATIKRI